jgi:uncharacterized protein (DUF2141 family)
MIEGIEKAEGLIGYVLFNQEEGFPEDEKKAYRKGEVMVDSKNLTIEIPDLPYGKYAVALLHDLNENRKMDKNFIGIPQEPFGFTRVQKLGFGAPSFEEAEVVLDQQQVVAEVRLYQLF